MSENTVNSFSVTSAHDGGSECIVSFLLHSGQISDPSIMVTQNGDEVAFYDNPVWINELLRKAAIGILPDDLQINLGISEHQALVMATALSEFTVLVNKLK